MTPQRSSLYSSLFSFFQNRFTKVAAIKKESNYIINRSTSSQNHTPFCNTQSAPIKMNIASRRTDMLKNKAPQSITNDRERTIRITRINRRSKLGRNIEMTRSRKQKQALEQYQLDSIFTALRNFEDL